MTVTDADSGEAALEVMRTEAAAGRAFAVALVDREMPVMDGLQLKDAVAADPPADLHGSIDRHGRPGEMRPARVRRATCDAFGLLLELRQPP
jgi:CheY-like chemotaxis protein